MPPEAAQTPCPPAGLPATLQTHQCTRGLEGGTWPHPARHPPGEQAWGGTCSILQAGPGRSLL